LVDQKHRALAKSDYAFRRGADDVLHIGALLGTPTMTRSAFPVIASPTMVLNGSPLRTMALEGVGTHPPQGTGRSWSREKFRPHFVAALPGLEAVRRQRRGGGLASQHALPCQAGPPFPARARTDP
jgi:hypothetical protein